MKINNNGEINGRVNKGFKVKVEYNRGSVLSPLLFIIVLEALSRTFREGLPMELLYADNLVLMAETRELLVDNIIKWKVGMEEKGLRVNMEKTKVMKCQNGTGKVIKSGKYPCGVCKKGVSSNTIKYTSCSQGRGQMSESGVRGIRKLNNVGIGVWGSAVSFPVGTGAEPQVY